MNLSEYIKQCGATSIWDLSPEQFLAFFRTVLKDKNSKRIDLNTYLNQCGVDSVFDLSDEQLLSYCLEGHCGLENVYAVAYMKLGILNMFPDKKESIEMLRSAVSQGKTLRFNFTIAEGVVDERGLDVLGESRIEMSIE